MLGLARVVAVVLGLMLIAFGLWIAFIENEGQLGLALLGLLTAFLGVFFIGVLAFERMRYRSEAAEPAASPGPPGGEPSGEPLEPRFRATDERFVDPSSGRPMRVYADPATGERRYLADDAG